MTAPPNLPNYALYGEAEGLPDLCHLEKIADRAGPLGWRIAPHRHGALVQFLHIERGGGLARLDAQSHRFGPGTLLFVPQLCAHGFDFAPGTAGHVLTLPLATLQEALRGIPAALARLTAPLVAPAPPHLPAAFAALSRETAAPVAFSEAMITTQIRQIALFAARQAGAGPVPPGDDGRSGLAAQFLSLLEARFRSHKQTTHYAAALGRSASHLNRACTGALGRTASSLIRDRVMLEARRQLAFTGTGVAQIAYGLGYRDAAYFSRVFRRATGQSPSDFRRSVQAAAEPEADA